MVTQHAMNVRGRRDSAPGERCEVLIVGGGPAGATCARYLIRSGFDVIVLDRAQFPRPKTCGGWITPQVVEELEIPLDDYASRYELQPIWNFRTGIVGDSRAVHTEFDRTVSYGIRRVEFDDYLLRRCGARLVLGEAVDSLERRDAGWVINGRYQASLVIGAGGHFCPVTRHMNEARKDSEHVVRAQEAEFRMTDDQVLHCRVRPETPELYFFPDFQGYAWCFRKNDYLNVGFGGMGYAHLSEKKAEFFQFLRETNRLGFEATAPFKGHAYRLRGFGARQLVDDGVLLIGDAAGLAYPQSGEGIRPAVESGLIAAQAIVECSGDYSRESLTRYQSLMDGHFGEPNSFSWLDWIPRSLRSSLARSLMQSRWFTRNVLIDRWFLHSSRPPLKRGPLKETESSAI